MKPIACEKAFTCLTKTSTREAAWGNSYKQTAPTLTPSVYMMWFLLRNKSRQFLEPGWFGGGGRGRIGEGKEVVSMATGGGRAGGQAVLRTASIRPRLHFCLLFFAGLWPRISCDMSQTGSSCSRVSDFHTIFHRSTFTRHCWSLMLRPSAWMDERSPNLDCVWDSLT